MTTCSPRRCAIAFSLLLGWMTAPVTADGWMSESDCCEATCCETSCDSCCDSGCMDPCQWMACECEDPFENFIGPISNPIFAKDPRSRTEIRGLFIHNELPETHVPFAGGDFQVYAAQIRVALSERLTLIADKDGYAVLNPDGVPDTDGWLNIAAGLRYQLIRDEERRFLLSGGFMWEFQTGEADVFQSNGDGLFTLFMIAGKEFMDNAHILANFGHVFPVDKVDHSSFLYMQLHLDYGIGGWLYPLVEFNAFHWTTSGQLLPSVVGEGDGLLNLGTMGVTGNDLVTIALGMKVKPTNNLEMGIVWETPISNRQDLIDDRILVETILHF